VDWREPISHRGKTLLLVEDEESDVLLFQRALTKAGVEARVMVVSDGRQALDYLAGRGAYSDRTRYPLPALVLLDLNLPGVKGLEVLQRLRQERAWNGPVIILSSSHSLEELDQAYELGASSYLVKPGDTSKLVGLCRALAGYWLEYNRCPEWRLA
jgi:DNA-binding response OmpR family regulator